MRIAAGTCMVARVRAAPDRAEAGRLGAALHRPQEPGLADARLRRRAGGTGRRRRDLGDPPVGEVQEVVAADEHRADERSTVVHAAECR